MNCKNACESNNIELKSYLTFSNNNQMTQNNKVLHQTLLFNDGVRRIDYVLVVRKKSDNKEDNAEKNLLARRIFESNLEEEGLELEHCENAGIDGHSFVKLYAPWDLLSSYAEVMKLRMPMKTIRTNLRMLFDDDTNDKNSAMVFTAPYSRDKEYLFDIPEDKEQFFTSAQRAQIVEFVLRRKNFSPDKSDVYSIGINKLISDNVYAGAYPLHDGKLKEDTDSIRRRLIKNWASLSSIHKSQPLDQILKYFGVKIAIYYAWLGFYTRMLIPASFIGSLCFLYGALTLRKDTPSKQVCDGKFDTYPMCPINCAQSQCNYTLLSHSCNYMRAAYLFDNPSTVLFAVFMSFWATIYLEMWKRYAAKITYKWDLTDFDAYEEYPRPEYLARLAHNRNAKLKLNIITRMQEPYISFLSGKLPHIVLSFTTVLMCVALAVGVMVSFVIYRVTVLAAINLNNDESEILKTYGSIFTSLTAAALNLICILILNQFYWRLAFYLTERELPRTQTEFDNSLTLKMYLFQFVNYYSSLFYIAFVKGRLLGIPGQQYNKSFVEECPTGGCFLDLSIQLSIIMVGKQALNGLIEMCTPLFKRLYNKWKYFGNFKEFEAKANLTQWEDDFILESWGPTSLFYEYLELVIQFGFITIFVCAFPLAPLFALINNILEIRLDAKKMIINFKRPVAQRVKSIGIWYRILDAIGKFSVITNAIIIAFTTEFVPRLYYFAENGDLDGYLNSTLSFFEIKDDKNFPPVNDTFCIFSDYREPPWTTAKTKYSRTDYYWRIMIARLAFIVVFENVIVMLTSLLRLLIPDVPTSLKQRIRQHTYLTNEMIMRQDKLNGRRSRLSKMFLTET